MFIGKMRHRTQGLPFEQTRYKKSRKKSKSKSKDKFDAKKYETRKSRIK